MRFACTTHGVDDTGKLSEQPISRVFDNPPTVLGDFRIDERTQVFSELDVSSLFVQARQPAISSHVCRQDSCQPSHQLSCGQGCAPKYNSVYASGLGAKDVRVVGLMANVIVGQRQV
jgi:hypothetical protein